MATLNGYSRDSVVRRLLTPHPDLQWPDATAVREEVQQVGAAARHVEVHVEVSFKRSGPLSSSGATSLLNSRRWSG